MASDIILHHYDFSNYSEKVRLVLGLKGLTWRSVEIPSTLPKPDYLPLTGGLSIIRIRVPRSAHCQQLSSADISLEMTQGENRWQIHPVD